MLLKDRIAVVHGAGGDIGGAVARAFAREGAKLYLSGRTLGTAAEFSGSAAGLSLLASGFTASLTAKPAPQRSPFAHRQGHHPGTGGRPGHR